jgi:dTMP kinase
MRGIFITIEGGEGVGKSTQSRLLANRLRDAGLTVLETREPGGTPTGDRIRALLLDPAAHISPAAELLLYEASRAQLVSEVIRPALDAGTTVLCDRFYDSTTAYQAFGRGLDAETIHGLNAAATGGLTPDITVYLALPVQDAMPRATRGGADRIEGEPPDFHHRVLAGFEAIVAAEPDRVVRLGAAGTPEEVAARVWDVVSQHRAVKPALSGPE